MESEVQPCRVKMVGRPSLSCLLALQSGSCRWLWGCSLLAIITDLTIRHHDIRAPTTTTGHNLGLYQHLTRILSPDLLPRNLPDQNDNQAQQLTHKLEDIISDTPARNTSSTSSNE